MKPGLRLSFFIRQTWQGNTPQPAPHKKDILFIIHPGADTRGICMASINNNILETIGNTPVVKINRLSPPGIEMFVKVESFNPMGSVKDRMALSVIEQARDFVQQLLDDGDQPVVLFALEWCEFCWSLRKLFARLGIPYRSIDLDSVEYQAEHRGSKIRAVLNDRLGSNTIPQVFIAGEHIGGATDTFDTFKDGHLQSKLAKVGIETTDLGDMDPYELLPNWLHKR